MLFLPPSPLPPASPNTQETPPLTLPPFPTGPPLHRPPRRPRLRFLPPINLNSTIEIAPRRGRAETTRELDTEGESGVGEEDDEGGGWW